MDIYKKIYRGLVRVSTIAAWIAVAALIVVTIMTTIDVIIKLISRVTPLNMFINGMYEFTQMCMILMIFLAYAFAEFSDTHVRVQIITSKLGPQGQRIMDIIVRVIMTAFCVILTYSCILQNKTHISGNLQTSVLFMSYTPFTIAMTVGVILFSLAMICKLINSIISLVKKGEDWEKDLMPIWKLGKKKATEEISAGDKV